ncbi:hypothetical protein [Butyricicoccus pullicaecorum]|uniref:GntT/GntP/DsdX family permease n=1 Tax=Butyricicoccus pullicaecorum TaxID=501571 RepID=UPI0003A7E871
MCSLDEKATFKTWTMMETIVGTTGFVVALIISLIFNRIQIPIHPFTTPSAHSTWAE